MADVTLQGVSHPRFERVREHFVQGFENGDELGASLCLTLEGETVVDLWAGHADAAGSRPWERETLVNVYSSTKGVVALAAHQLVDEGRLDLDAPVAHYWSAFAAGGKERLPVRYLLSHQAGMAAVRKPLPPGSLFDWEVMTGALAEQEPWWEPGSAHGYHALTFGWLVGEVVRRITGQRIGDVVRERIAGPLGIRFEIGFGPALDPQVADLVQGPIHPPEGDIDFDLVKMITEEPEGLFAKAFANPPVLGEETANSRPWRAAEIPGANGHGSAAALARIYGALANGGSIDGVRLISAEQIDRARVEQCRGSDAVLPMPTRLGLGFFLPTDEEPLGPNPRAFCHGGAGGSLGFADPEHRLSLGYAMNRMHQGAWLVDPRPRRFLADAYAVLGKGGTDG